MDRFGEGDDAFLPPAENAVSEDVFDTDAATDPNVSDETVAVASAKRTRLISAGVGALAGFAVMFFWRK